jgi:hypothetical protein
MGFRSLHGGGVGFSFVDCFSGGFSNGEDEYRT